MLKNYVFDDKRQNEKVLIILKRHPIVLLKGFFYACLMIVIIIAVFIILKASLISFIVLIFGILAIAVIIGYNLFNWYNDLYVLTNQRLIDVDQSGLFTRTTSETQLDQIQEIKVEVKGFLESLLGFGKVIIQTAGPKENIVLEVVPNPHGMENMINKAFYEYRQKVFSEMGNTSKENINEQNVD